MHLLMLTIFPILRSNLDGSMTLLATNKESHKFTHRFDADYVPTLRPNSHSVWLYTHKESHKFMHLFDADYLSNPETKQSLRLTVHPQKKSQVYAPFWRWLSFQPWDLVLMDLWLHWLLQRQLLLLPCHLEFLKWKPVIRGLSGL